MTHEQEQLALIRSAISELSSVQQAAIFESAERLRQDLNSGNRYFGMAFALVAAESAVEVP